MPVSAEKQPAAAGRQSHADGDFSSCLNDSSRYRRWRAQKLARAARYRAQPVVEISNPARLAPTELAALRARVEAMNFAFYRTDANLAFDHRALKLLCRQAGLGRLAANPFSASSGISEIRVAGGARRGYIPYSNRALNWHTDGYYNPPGRRIHGFAMHTIRPAAGGGENRFLDHELLYLLLRDRDPALAACLFDAEAMTIPPGIEAGGTARAAQTGPVFSLTGGRLHMRFTLRKRHVAWKRSAPVRAALAEIEAILDDSDNSFILTRRFAAGEGVIGNNVLHNRAGFADPDGGRSGQSERSAGRLVLRARFYDFIFAHAVKPEPAGLSLPGG